MLLEDAIKLVIKAAEKYGQRSVEECDEIFEATGVVQDFFANKVMTDVERDVVEDLFNDWLTLVSVSINEDEDVTRIYKRVRDILETPK